MERKNTSRKVATGLASLLIVLWGGNAFAQQLDVDNDGMDKAGKTTISTTEALAVKVVSGPFDLTVKVDNTYCATGGIQCTTTGHTAQEAGPTNHNPVRLGLQILDPLGNPIDGLPSDAISVFNPFVPAGGPSVTRLDCPSCFGAAGQGLYTIFVHPAPVNFNWKSGSYFVQTQVTVKTIEGPRVVRALSEIEIPF